MKEENSFKLAIETIKGILGKLSLRSRVEVCVLLGYMIILVTYVAICGGFG